MRNIIFIEFEKYFLKQQPELVEVIIKNSNKIRKLIAKAKISNEIVDLKTERKVMKIILKHITPNCDFGFYCEQDKHFKNNAYKACFREFYVGG